MMMQCHGSLQNSWRNYYLSWYNGMKSHYLKKKQTARVVRLKDVSIITKPSHLVHPHLELLTSSHGDNCQLTGHQKKYFCQVLTNYYGTLEQDYKMSPVFLSVAYNSSWCASNNHLLGYCVGVYYMYKVRLYYVYY